MLSPLTAPSSRPTRSSGPSDPPRPAVAPRSLSIFGATGSIGESAVDLLRRNPEAWRLVVLSGRRRVDRLAALAAEFRPELVVIADPDRLHDLRAALRGLDIAVAAGPEALVEAASRPVDVALGAILGAAALAPMIAALRNADVVALANKECLACAGDLFIAEAERRQTTVIPVDSEHNAVFQLLDCERKRHVERIVLTASGGPFRTWPAERIAAARPADALAHPTWSMGAKISVDSATLMNKGLELIEAHHLFAMPPERLGVIVHPESIVHCLIDHIDGSTFMHSAPPDMRVAIASALAWPERMPTPVADLDWTQIGRLTFEAPDRRRFPALGLAEQALRSGGAAPAILNAANEVAVAAFLEEKIGFAAISALVAETLERFDPRTRRQDLNNLDYVLHIDRSARRLAEDMSLRFAL